MDGKVEGERRGEILAPKDECTARHVEVRVPVAIELRSSKQHPKAWGHFRSRALKASAGLPAALQQARFEITPCPRRATSYIDLALRQ